MDITKVYETFIPGSNPGVDANLAKHEDRAYFRLKMQTFSLIFAFFVLAACKSAPVPPVEITITEVADHEAPVVDAAPEVAVEAAPPPCRDAKGIWHLPNPEWTPGLFCTASDPDFVGYRYEVHIPYCRRHVTESEKDDVARLYGIPKADYSKYEFDHFIPLSAGGSDSPKNIWPQPLAEAKEKDKVEEAVYEGLRKGTMTQAEAEEKLHAWRPRACP